MASILASCTATACRLASISCSNGRRQPIHQAVNHFIVLQQKCAVSIIHHRDAFSTQASIDNDDTEQIMYDDGLDQLTTLSRATRHRIRSMKARHDEVLRLLHEGGDPTSLGKEMSTLREMSAYCEKVAEIHAERTSLRELLEETNASGDEDSKDMIEEIKCELEQLEAQLQPLSQKMHKSLIPVLNPEDAEELTSSDAVIDIRAGTGGDEACLFAAEIMAGYEAVAKAGGDGGKSWDIEILSCSRTDLGGVKEASLAITARGGGGGGGGFGYESCDVSSDDDTPSEEDMAHKLLQQLGPYGFFQYESGVHRVQRVPVNDNKLQTSAVSVGVLPAIPESQVEDALPLSELKIDVMRASGAGGQHVNTTESAVRITHIPTGIMAYMQEERSQHKNRTKAMRLVAARVHSLRKQQALQERSDARSSLMGGGDRSERVRTYNFPQDRITDHRCKVSVQGVQSWLSDGSMVGKFAPHLYQMERDERTAALEEELESDSGKNEKKRRKK
ncbi:hypothetical protein ACHAXM_007266 [Skeletonema potamos]